LTLAISVTDTEKFKDSIPVKFTDSGSPSSVALNSRTSSTVRPSAMAREVYLFIALFGCAEIVFGEREPFVSIKANKRKKLTLASYWNYLSVIILQ